MTAPIYWTLDLGNSALKLCERSGLDSAAKTTAVLETDDRLIEKLRAKLKPVELRGVALSSVASERLTAEIEELLRDHSSTFVKSTDALLANESTVPETVGQDRLFAALGALELLPQDVTCALICDAGTALTVDLVLRNPETDAVRGRFVGGAIAPGPELLARALASGGARLFDIAEYIAREQEPPALGRDTQGALASGVVHGFRGAARELATRIAEEAGLASPPVCLTGGARRLLAGVFPEDRVHEEAGLVDRGLVAALARELA